jgi:Thioesterase-like superfamily
MCLTQDVDLYFTHMNNNRMAREMDLAVYYTCSRTTCISDAMMKGVVWKSASTIRFRRPVPIFSIYKINTKVRLI